MRNILVIMTLAAASALSGPAQSQDAAGCGKFKWDITRERAVMNRTDISKLASGSDLTGPLPQAVVLTLQPAAEAKLPSPPERAPQPGTFAGFTTVKQIPSNGLYSVSLSAHAWVDVLQNGAFINPKGHSGAPGCEGIRKTLKFDLVAGPVTVQVSGVDESAIKMAIMPVTE